MAEMDTEIKLLRGYLSDERAKREQYFYEYHQMFSQLQQQLHSQESELMKRLKEHREDQLSYLNNNTDEKQLLERMKQERVDNDFGFVKGMITTIDKKLDEEITFRMRSEDDIRKWFDQKFTMMNERVNIEERGSLEREKRMMQQLQEGLHTLSEIVRGVKEQAAIGITEVHTMQIENFTDLQRRVDNINENVNQRQLVVEAALSQMKERIDQLEHQSLKHAKTVNEQLNKEINRMEKISTAIEKQTQQHVQDLRDELKLFDERLEKWRISLEETEGKKFLELHQAMKILN